MRNANRWEKVTEEARPPEKLFPQPGSSWGTHSFTCSYWMSIYHVPSIPSLQWTRLPMSLLTWGLYCYKWWLAIIIIIITATTTINIFGRVISAIRKTSIHQSIHSLKKDCLGFPGGAVVESLPANAGDMGSSPGLGRYHMPRSNWAREPQLLSLRVWSLCSATREAAIVRGPCTAMKSGPCLPQLEKALAQKLRPNTAKNN